MNLRIHFTIPSHTPMAAELLLIENWLLGESDPLYTGSGEATNFRQCFQLCASTSQSLNSNSNSELHTTSSPVCIIHLCTNLPIPCL